jgi:hypothetical protein
MSRGASGLGLRNLGREPPPPPPPKPPRKPTVKTKAKGRRAEREVKTLWRSNGWPDAFLTPRSGALRVDGSNFPPFPLDLCSGWPAWYDGDRVPRYGPWIIEVKHTERDIRIAGRGWTGEAYIRSVLARQVVQTVNMVNRSVVGSGEVHPVLFARASRTPWRVFVPVYIAQRTWHIPEEGMESWVELPGGAAQYFAEMSETVL